MAYWEGVLRGGSSLTTVANAFAGSTEFTTTYSGLSGTALNNAVISNFYNQGLARTSDANGAAGRSIRHRRPA